MKFRKLLKKCARKLSCTSGAELSFEHAIWTVIIFVLGGILLSSLTAAFKSDIIPSLIESFKNIITW